MALMTPTSGRPLIGIDVHAEGDGTRTLLLAFEADAEGEREFRANFSAEDSPMQVINALNTLCRELFHRYGYDG